MNRIMKYAAVSGTSLVTVLSNLAVAGTLSMVAYHWRERAGQLFETGRRYERCQPDQSARSAARPTGWRPITISGDEQAEVFLEVRGDSTVVIVSASDQNVLRLAPDDADALIDELRAFATAARSVAL